MHGVVSGSRVPNGDHPPLGLTAAARIAAMTLALCLAPGQSPAQSRTPGASVEELLAIARERTPELTIMRLEAEAVADRVGPSAAFPDPLFRVELQDIDNNRVGATKYTFVQLLPWFGKRDLRRAGAVADAEAARMRIDDTWPGRAGCDPCPDRACGDGRRADHARR